MEAILPQYIDSTMRGCLRSCEQKFYNEFILGLRPKKPSIDLHAGAVFASTIEAFHREAWEKGASVSDALARAHLTFVREWGDFIPEKETSKTPDRMWDAVERYALKFDPRTDHCQPYFVNGKATSEFSFAIPLEPATDSTVRFANVREKFFPLHPVSLEPFIYCGRADLLGKYNNRPCIRDEKTAGKLESNWTEKWSMRAQFMGYCWAAQQGGIDCDTVIVRGIVPYKEKPPALVEAIKMYPRWMLDRWHTQLRRDLWRLVDCWHDKWFDYDLGEACVQYGHCHFMPLCTTQEHLRDNFRDAYEVRRWNPLERDQSKGGDPSVAASTALIGPPRGPIVLSDSAPNLAPSNA